ncbi:MAG: hypothetical protein E7554_04540 [Ruminococcaceae bacterium]|nr:hypothetical protein [Oscillospiraceae bacterium]
MTGLEKILERIQAGADLQAADIMDEARAEAAEILKKADAATEAKSTALVDVTREKAELIGRIADSGSELEGRKLLLSLRQELIAGVIDEALKRLRALPAEQYFSVCERLACRFADKGEGEILFSAADRERLPGGFMDALNGKLSDKGAKLTLAADTVETNGGFVLRYGGIEENCSFAAIVEQHRDSLSDQLGKILFD